MGNPEPIRGSLPWKTLAWTLLAGGAIAVLSLYSETINDQTVIGPGEANLIKYLLMFITAIIWFNWLAVFSRIPGRLAISLTILALTVLFFYFFRLDMDGSLGFVRIASRFEKRELKQAVDTSDEKKIDLSKTSDSDFNQFLGNGRDSVIRNCRLDTDWKNNPPVLKWKQPIGEGWSGFVAVNGYAITQEQRGNDECVSCYEIETGELLWIHKRETRHEDMMSMGKVGPRATPAIDDGKIYAQGATGFLTCLDSNGTELWSIDLTERLQIELQKKKTSADYTYYFEKSPLAWGRSGSPLIYKNMCIVTGGGPTSGPFTTLLALDKVTGEEIWTGGKNMISYGSPSIAKLLGRDQVTLVAESSAMGFDPYSGKVLWETEREGSSSANANCSQVTPISDNRILLSKAYQLGGEIVELNETGESISPSTVWQNSRVLKTKMMSPVIKDGYAYSLSDGFFECSNIEDDELEGRRTFRKRDRFGNGQLLLVGDHLLIHTEYGKLKLVKATPDKYVELGEIPTITGICWNTICLCDKYLLVRSELEAACFELSLTYDDAEVEQASSESTSSATGVANAKPVAQPKVTDAR